jgi:hypothetical protein
MSTCSDSYVSKVLFAANTAARNFDEVRGRWWRLTTSNSIRTGTNYTICAALVRSGGRSTHAAEGARHVHQIGPERGTLAP